MTIRFYMDVHVHSAVTDGLRLRGLDVLTAQEDGCDELDDDRLLLRATALGRLLITQDSDFLRKGPQFASHGTPFSGIFYGHQLTVGIGAFVEDLTLVALTSDASEWANRVTHLPL